ncbi:MerR family transcriptional regulator [Promicromonospora sp. NPDC050249]|uniref:MerR family transcriptional regulator n=1 Tax=Promicromonospora sp. NPDC050249 TaxID=3154743 RepID=UPI003400B045
MRIGQLARRTGTSQRALRYYEAQGLLAPTRQASGYRVYGDDDVALVHRIRTLLAAGLTTAQIRDVLPCLVDVEGLLTPDCPELVDGLVQERNEIDRAIAQLRATRSNLDRIIGGERRAG